MIFGTFVVYFPIVGFSWNIKFPLFFGTFVVYPPLWDLQKVLYLLCFSGHLLCISHCGTLTKYWISNVFRDICSVSSIVGPPQSIEFPLFFGIFVVYPPLWDIHKVLYFRRFSGHLLCIPHCGASTKSCISYVFGRFVVCPPLWDPLQSIEFP